jgi:His-Xaa-Ser system protein HxsD
MSAKDSSKSVSNLEIHKDHVLVSINPKIYPLDIVYSALYVFLDRAYVVVDGDPKREIVVELRPKDRNKGLEELGRDFNNELINYAVYTFQSEKGKQMRDYVVRRAMESVESAGEERIEDPEGIAIPWEEKYARDK